MRIYVAGPITSPLRRTQAINCLNAIEIGYELLKRGHAPYIPHLKVEFDRLGYKIDYEEYMVWDEQFLRLCNGFYLVAHSPGATRELKLAMDIGLRIFQRLDEVPRITEIA